MTSYHNNSSALHDGTKMLTTCSSTSNVIQPILRCLWLAYIYYSSAAASSFIHYYYYYIFVH